MRVTASFLWRFNEFMCIYIYSLAFGTYSKWMQICVVIRCWNITDQAEVKKWIVYHGWLRTEAVYINKTTNKNHEQLVKTVWIRLSYKVGHFCLLEKWVAADRKRESHGGKGEKRGRKKTTWFLICLKKLTHGITWMMMTSLIFTCVTFLLKINK